jgi:RHS repeat-associated protein
LAGQYFDAEFSLHYNWHRTYSPTAGRYLTADPIGLSGGINLFAYVYNSPSNLSDPLGLETAALPGPVPIPIIPTKTIAQQQADREIANAVYEAWIEYIDPSLDTAGDLLYGGGIGDWIYDVSHSASKDVCLTMGKGKGDKYGPLWNAPGMPGWEQPTGDPNKDKDFWKKPSNWKKMSKWQRFKWRLGKIAGALASGGGVGMF